MIWLLCSHLNLMVSADRGVALWRGVVSARQRLGGVGGVRARTPSIFLEEMWSRHD